MAPVTTAARAVGVAKGAGRIIAGALHRGDDEKSAQEAHEAAQPEAAAPTEDSSEGAEQGIDLLPYPDLEDPVPVVEQALDAEEEGVVPVEGHATEPHASSRDESHGDAQL